MMKTSRIFPRKILLAFVSFALLASYVALTGCKGTSTKGRKNGEITSPSPESLQDKFAVLTIDVLG